MWGKFFFLLIHDAFSLKRPLTLCADDPWSLPAPIGPAACGGDVALVEAFRALVAHH